MGFLKPNIMDRSSDRHFLAPHLDHVMEHRFSWDSEEVYWLTRKPKAFLNRAIGQKAWAISKSELEDGDGGFFLEGSFFVSKIAKRRYPDHWKFEVFGEDVQIFGDGVHLDETAFPLIDSLIEKQNHFHFGFNDLTDEDVIEAFERIESDFM